MKPCSILAVQEGLCLPSICLFWICKENLALLSAQTNCNSSLCVAVKKEMGTGIASVLNRYKNCASNNILYATKWLDHDKRCFFKFNCFLLNVGEELENMYFIQICGGKS